MSRGHFLLSLGLLLLSITTLAEARGGGRGGGGRGRGRSSASGYIQRGNPKWKPNPSQETRTFEWSKVTRFIAKIFGAGAIKGANSNGGNIYKGYQGAYKPQNVYHPKKPRPVGPPPAYPGLEHVPVKSHLSPPPYVRESHIGSINTLNGREVNHRPLLYAAIFYNLGARDGSLMRHHQHHNYYDYSHVDRNQATDRPVVVVKEQSLTEWMTEADGSELAEGTLLRDEVLKLPYYAQTFENWTVEAP